MTLLLEPTHKALSGNKNFCDPLTAYPCPCKLSLLPSQVLPYLIILAILPQIKECINFKAKIIKREGNKVAAENLYKALEIQIQLQILMEKVCVSVHVEKEDFLKRLSKKEKYKN